MARNTDILYILQYHMNEKGKYKESLNFKFFQNLGKKENGVVVSFQA